MNKKTWYICNDAAICNIFDDVWSYVSLNYDLDDCPDLYLNNSKSIRQLGLFTLNNQGYPIIILNELFKHHIDKALNTILHEFAHYIAYIKYRKNCHHDYRWKEIAYDLGKHYNEKITTYCSNAHEVLEEARAIKTKNKDYKISYEIKCTSCNKTFIYHKQMWWFRDKKFLSNDKCTCPKCRNHSFEVKVIKEALI